MGGIRRVPRSGADVRLRPHLPFLLRCTSGVYIFKHDIKCICGKFEIFQLLYNGGPHDERKARKPLHLRILTTMHARPRKCQVRLFHVHFDLIIA